MSPVSSVQVLSSGRSSHHQHPDFSPTRILAAFNTWAFKREQPSSTTQIETAILQALRDDLPLSFVLYWGKGPRESVAQPDVQCLDFLGSLGDRISAVCPTGAQFTLICTDTHATLNGHSQAGIDSYFADIAAAGAERGFTSCRLSDVVRDSGLTQDPTMSCDEAHLQLLLRSAERWFRGNGSVRDGAVTYLQTNMIERRAVEMAFPAAIFATFNGSEFNFLFPESLPKFYMYSLRKGCSVKPWFMDADGQPITLLA